MPTRSALYQAPFAPGAPQAIDARSAERLLEVALAQGGDYADLFFEYRVSGGIVFDEGIIQSATRGVSMGLGVRVVKGDATGHAFVQQLDWDAMKRAATTASQIARGGGARMPISVGAVAALPGRYELDEVTLDVSGGEKRRLLERAATAAFGCDSRVLKVEGIVMEELREILVVTSDGRMAHDVQPLVRFNVRVIVEKGDRRGDASSGGGGRTTLAYFQQKTPEWHARRAVEDALRTLEAREAPAGVMPVVLGPGDSGILLHEAVGHGLEGDFNRKGVSNYSGKIGAGVASELCTVIDDPTIDRARGSINVDDEGNEPRPSVLIENGRLARYMHDRQSAAFFGLAPTGHGRREGFSSAPLPRMTNTILAAGPHDPEEIVGSVKKGIYARRFGGGEVDIGNGDFVFSLTDSYLIEDGRITAPLKGVNLIGNGPAVLRKVTMLGRDLEISDGMWTCGKRGQSVPVGVGCPTMKISEITVGGTEIA
jgi:TldD protein